MKKGTIIHLEDDSEWIEHVGNWLDDEYTLYSVSDCVKAATLFWELAAEGPKVDLAIIDISLVLGNSHDKQGLQFIELMEESGVMLGHSIIVLSGYSNIDQNMRTAFRDYDVVDVFDKGDFPEAISKFVEAINKTIMHLHDKF